MQFEEKQKSGSEFRDWKRRHKNARTVRLPSCPSASIELAPDLQAASEPKKRDELWTKALDHIDTILKDAKDLEGAQGMLRQNVLDTVFAEAYSVDNIDITDWPGSPLQLEAVYEGLVLPSLRSMKTLSELEQAWERRILHEGTMIEIWNKPKKGLGRPENSPPMEQFLEERRPQLQWKKEMDLFAVGDQKRASLRMLKHKPMQPIRTLRLGSRNFGSGEGAGCCATGRGIRDGGRSSMRLVRSSPDVRTAGRIFGPVLGQGRLLMDSGACSLDFAVPEVGKMLPVNQLKGDLSFRGDPRLVLDSGKGAIELERDAEDPASAAQHVITTL